MNSCPNCRKTIINTVAEKYTCTCGEIIQISNKGAQIIYEESKIDTLKMKFRDFIENFSLVLIIVTLVASDKLTVFVNN
jgi:hypothetical protein